ncbi:MAG: hypothetical protein UIC64_07635 [Agathobacter sp.]|nr:hypothetical protein [Agathobacter sp.]
MKKNVFATGMVLAMTLASSTIVYAAGNIPVVSLTDKDEFKYFENEASTVALDEITLTEFSGMAPGDTRTQTILVKNESDETRNFYISQQTLQALEDGNDAAGGAYQFDMSVGQNTDDAVSLLEAWVGGYTTADGAGSTEGLSEITELSDYVFLSTLAPGESTKVYIDLYLNGEGNDNQLVDYSNAVATLALQFRASDPEKTKIYIHEPNTVVEKLVDRIVYTQKTVEAQTGDIPIWGFVLVLVAGVGLVVIARVRSKKGDS